MSFTWFLCFGGGFGVALGGVVDCLVRDVIFWLCLFIDVYV